MEKDTRINRITVYSHDGNSVVRTYEGKIHTFFSDKEKEGCVHFVDEEGKHHRIYGDQLVIIDEM